MISTWLLGLLEYQMLTKMLRRSSMDDEVTRSVALLLQMVKGKGFISMRQHTRMIY